MKSLVAVVSFAVVFVLAAACGNANSGAPSDEAGTEHPGSGQDLRILSQRFAEFRGRIELRGGVSDEGTGEATLYLDPPRSRMDFGDAGELSIFTTAEASYTCVRLEGEGYCFVNEGGEGDILFGQAISMDPRGFVSLARQFDNADVEVSGDRIADRDATCFTASNLHDMADKTTLCFAVDGALLLWSEVNDGQTFEFRATRITSDVSAADFELPYEIREPTLEDLFPTP